MELKEVLHLYIGCDCLADNIKFKLHGVEYTDTGTLAYDGTMINEIHQCWWVENCDFKPILRPLSDMTEEEYEYVLSNFNLVSRGQTVQQFIIAWRAFTPECTLYLLSRHFDLFSLIESGQAIDKTTINNKK